MTAAAQRQMRGAQRRADDQGYLLNGELIYPKSSGGSPGFKKPFDVDPGMSGLNLRLLFYVPTTSFVLLRGALQNVGCGTGWTLDSDNKAFCLTLSVSQLIYLKFSRVSASVTIEAAANEGAAFVTPDDFAYRPLWFVVVSNGAVDLDNTIDLRDSYFIDGIS